MNTPSNIIAELENMPRKLVVVVGATGRQGDSAINALLAHGGYDIRGLTRDIWSPASQALRARGVEMVQVAWNDKVSLTRAFQGAYAVFGVTLSFRQDNETTQGQNMVDACLADNVPLFIWSSLPSAKEESHGKWTTIRAFEEKSAVDKYIKVVGQPAVIFHTGMFTENLLEHGGGHQLVPVYPDKWEICYPMVPSNVRQPTTYVEKDVGPAVVAVINHWDDSYWRERLSKEPIPLCSYTITGKEMATTIAQVTGKEVMYITMTETVQEPIKSLFAFSAEYSYPYELPAPILLELGVKFHSFEDFVLEKAVPFMKEILKI